MSQTDPIPTRQAAADDLANCFVGHTEDGLAIYRAPEEAVFAIPAAPEGI